MRLSNVMILRFIFLLCALAFSASLYAEELDSVPSPDDQGGMVMAMVSIVNADDLSNPTTGVISVMLAQKPTPQILPLTQQSYGNWFAADAAWRMDLSPAAGVGGTPSLNAGRGDRFNNQYGFIFKTGTGMAKVPAGHALGIKIVSISSTALRSFNYSYSNNLWDEVFTTAQRPQVLWNGAMWHNYFTLPAMATPGIYTATYEVFIANTTFTSGTGYADYSPNALAATPNLNFTPATFTCTWIVPPPLVAAISHAGNSSLISVLSATNKNYLLESSSNPFAAEWSAVGVPQSGTGGVLSFSQTNAPSADRNFYRVMELRQIVP